VPFSSRKKRFETATGDRDGAFTQKKAQALLEKIG